MENHEVIFILSLLTDNPLSPGNVSDTTGALRPLLFSNRGVVSSTSRKIQSAVRETDLRFFVLIRED